jgi:hypothetical protein
VRGWWFYKLDIAYPFSSSPVQGAVAVRLNRRGSDWQTWQPNFTKGSAFYGVAPQIAGDRGVHILFIWGKI